MEQKSGIIQRVMGITGSLGQAALAFMAMSIMYDVIMRYLFTAPTIWVLEVNTFTLVFFCTVPVAYVLRGNGHLRVTFLTDMLSPRVQIHLLQLRGAIGMLFCALMAWKSGLMAWQAWLYNDRMSTTLGTPMVIPYVFVPIGFCLLGLEFGLMLKTSSKAALSPPSGNEIRADCTDGVQQI